jgi:chemotaxis protein CheD
MSNSLSVGLGELVISHDPEDVLVAYGLGSCVGIGMYNPHTHTGGLLHAVLPEKFNGDGDSATKFVNTGIPILFDKLKINEADAHTIMIYMAGGANMLINSQIGTTFDIGTRNVATALQTLEKMKLRLINSEVGGNNGRTVRLYISSGRMTVRVIGGTEKEL